MTENIFEVLREDHDYQRGLLKELIANGGDGHYRQVLYELRAELSAHAAAEEEVFYARLLESPRTASLGAFSLDEHSELEDLLDDLEALDIRSSEWPEHFARFAKEFREHLEAEELELFPLAASVLEEWEECELATSFRDVKLPPGRQLYRLLRAG